MKTGFRRQANANAKHLLVKAAFWEGGLFEEKYGEQRGCGGGDRLKITGAPS